MEALKGRPDLNHGCNPCAQTPTQHKGKPRLLLLLLALLAITTTAQAQTVTVTHDNVKYVLYNDGTAYVDYSPGAIGTLNLRETVSYKSLTCTVTRIADGAFNYNYQITGNLVIPNTVTHIGSNAFRGCSGLNGTLTLPDSLLTIGNNAFYQCTNLTGQLSLPATLTSIGSAAFSGCSGFDWSTLTLPPLLTEIGYDTFYGIQFTGDLVVPDGVTSIGDDAFNHNKFSSITIGNGVTTIGHRAFRLTAADQLTLGSSVASIGDEAFRYYDEDITHDHIINIKCLNAVPAALGQNVFLYHSERLVEVPCGARDAYISSSGWGVSYGPNENISEPRIKVELMGVYYLLNPCDGTATVTHSGYTELDENNNSYDGSLYSTIVIPSTVEHEGEIYRVTRIGAHAFLGASEVRTVEIGNYVESIGNYAFNRVNNLIQVICHNPVPPACGADVFYAPDAIPYHLYYLEVPCGSVEAYRNASQWSSFKNFGTLDFKAKVEINGIHYVLYCDGTANVTHAGYSDANSNNGSYSGYVSIPETVEYNGETHIVNRIRNNAFKGCTALTSVTVGKNVENIGNNAFEGCIALTYVSMGNVENIGDAAFKGCTALTSVTIGENVENIGNNAFDGCTALSSITSERLEPPALGSDVFLNVPTSAVLNVPCTATEAYAAAAQWQDFNIQGVVAAYINAQIDGVYYVLNPCAGTATVTHAGYDEIANAYYMNSYPDAVAITIPETVTHEGATYDVTRIGAYAFLFSTSLTSIVIGEKVGYVGGDAFGGCSGLQSITSKNPTPPTLGWGGDVFQQVPTSA
ncbi:MAG: leucine-rich repeat protein, partial [Bacteroidales bacterium]|nr:leucine-rich repeat protein [Bacteroidales bacterium]